MQAGVDEVGIGPLAGPVYAAAVVLDPARPITGLQDSKRLSSKQRESLAQNIKTACLSWSLGRASVAEVDRLNVLRASHLAMQRAVEGLSHRPDAVLVDGNKKPPLSYPVSAIVRGDGRVPQISAASILAKVARDEEMIRLNERYPGYGFASHKGYPTRQHVAALQELGVSAAHRQSFAPVRAAINQVLKTTQMDLPLS